MPQSVFGYLGQGGDDTDKVLGRALQHPQRGRTGGQTHLPICENLLTDHTCPQSGQGRD